MKDLKIKMRKFKQIGKKEACGSKITYHYVSPLAFLEQNIFLTVFHSTFPVKKKKKIKMEGFLQYRFPLVRNGLSY